MMKAMTTAATGMQSQQTNVDVIANNIANSATTAYRAQRASFQDLVYDEIRAAGSQSADDGSIVPNGIQIGSGSAVTSVYRIDGGTGSIDTGKDTDVMIQGRGFFQIQLPNGDTAYTRDGAFTLSSDGTLVTQDGYQVQPGITIPSNFNSITINSAGEVLVTLSGQTAANNVGQLELANFTNPSGLKAFGSNMFLETDASGAAVTDSPGGDGFGSIRQRALESSNVNIVTEITTMIAAQRAYELNSKVIQAADEMMQTANQVRR